MATGNYLGFAGMIVGAVIGAAITRTPAGAMWGASIGGMIGGVTGAALFPERFDLNLPPPPQPREHTEQISSYGAPIPIVYESGRLAGNIIYMSDVTETVVREQHRQDGVRYYTYIKTYTCTIAIAFCEGPVEGISRIWVNNEVFADYRDPNSQYYPTGSSDLAYSNLSNTIARSETYFSVYLGTEDQSADSSVASIIGADETPAYKGICYIVFMDFPVGEYSGIPQIEVEIGKALNQLCLLDFTESDTPSKLTVNSCTEAYWNNIVYPETAYLTPPDNSSLLIDDFTILYEIEISSLTAFILYDVTRLPKVGTAGTYCVVNLDYQVANTLKFVVRLVVSGVVQATATGTTVYSSFPLNRYMSFVRSGTSVSLYVYTDSSRTALEETITATHASFTATTQGYEFGAYLVNNVSAATFYIRNLITNYR